MNTIVGILINPSKTFEYLYDKVDHTLNALSNFIFIVYGVVVGIELNFKDSSIIHFGLGYKFILVGLSAMLSLVFWKYILSFLFLAIGKLLKGKAQLIDIRVVFAYSLIPLILPLPLILYLGLNDRYSQLSEIESLVIFGIEVVTWLFSFNILVKGLMEYNKYGVVKALINLSIFWVWLLVPIYFIVISI